jgi:endothelin-converting enzyme/putative endopeptidase
MFQLAGAGAADAQAAAEMVFTIEKQLAEASFDNVTLRDPPALDHQTTFQELEKMAPRFGWAGYFKGAGINPVPLNVQQPKFLAEVDRRLAETPVAAWKTYWKRCVESTDRLLGEALGRKYTEKYFPPEAKARMLELVQNL